MMISPFANIESAFAPMFTEAAEFTTSSGIRGTVPCCVFPIEAVDPFVETDVANDVRRANILVRKCDWITLKEEPKVGDSVTTPDTKRWKIETFDIEQDWYRLGVRSA